MSEYRRPELIVPVSEERDHIQGPASAPVTIVEYGDFDCPRCGQAHPMLQKLQQQAGQRLRLVFRHFPLSQLHPHARLAAQAAEAAGLQGRFWQMHDRLLEHQQRLDEQALTGHAQALGLDLQRFEADLQGSAAARRVREDFSSGLRSGVNGTPTFFVNGRRHDGGHDLQSMLAVVEQLSRPRP